MRRSRARLRITGQLVDAASGAHLWSDRFDGDLGDVFALQERVSACVAAAIEPILQFAEAGRLRQDRPAQFDAYDFLLQAYALLSDFTADSMVAALRCLDQSLAVDPAYAPAMAAAAYCRAQRHFQGWAQQDDAGRAQAVKLAWRAVKRAPNDAQVLWMAAFAVWNMAQNDRERHLFSRSLLVNPNSAMALTLARWIETMCGNQGAGREMVARAQRLNPRDPRGWLMSGVMAIAAVVDENYAEAVNWAERALAQNRRFAVAFRVVAAARVRLGQEDRTRMAVQELLEIEPELTISGFFAGIPFPLESLAKTYADALKVAGLLE